MTFPNLKRITETKSPCFQIVTSDERQDNLQADFPCGLVQKTMVRY